MKWLLYLVTIFLIVITITIISAFFYNKVFAERFFPGVKINNQSLLKLTPTQAVDLLQKQVDDFIKQGLNYRFAEKNVTIFSTLTATSDPDVSYNLITYDIPKTVSSAYLTGRKQGYRKNFFNQARALIFGSNIHLDFEFDKEEFIKILKEKLEVQATPKLDARPQIDQELNISIQAEKTGTIFDYPSILNQTLGRLTTLSNEPIEINLIVDVPQITQTEITFAILDDLKNLLATSTLTLTYEKKEWPIDKMVLKNWLIFKKIDQQISLGLDASTTLAYLKENIAPEIYRATLDAKFEIKQGRVVEFQGSQDGQELDLEKSILKIEELFSNQEAKIALVVSETKSKISTDSVNELGITKIIGTGHSKFSGSPKNRRHNINIGAQSLNGILIKPDEEFSLITALGKIDDVSGYKPELVIKGDKTIAEYGGGLCQIGTTVFRSALASGLPITERRPHSYRVVYYEPAGKDATIYNPRPDLKFLNDTGNYILIQSRIEGDNLYFDFWGTEDGRTTEQSDSVIYNITGSGPTQYVETNELKPGETRCTESAHAGADAYFDYKVTYPNGEIKEERFTSHYVPWPARCLVGVEPESATSTEEIIEE